MRYNEILLEKAAAKFQLAPGLDPADYQITPSLGDARQWRARVYVNNNAGAAVGEMDEIGYVWISIKDNTIIPIALADEHHEGGDMVHRLIRQKKLIANVDDYVRVSTTGTNYIYNDNAIKSWLIGLKKYISYGGNPDTILSGAHDMKNLMMSLGQFVASKGKIKLVPGTLAPMGKQFYDAHKALTEVFIQANQTDKPAPAFAAAEKMIAYYQNLPSFLGIKRRIPELQKDVAEARRSRDLAALNLAFFGFDSIKQFIHVEMKKERDALKTGDFSVWGDRWVSFWGDLDLAASMLGHIV